MQARTLKLLQKVVKKTAKEDASFDASWQQHVAQSGQPGLGAGDATKEMLVRLLWGWK